MLAGEEAAEELFREVLPLRQEGEGGRGINLKKKQTNGSDKKKDDDTKRRTNKKEEEKVQRDAENKTQFITFLPWLVLSLSLTVNKGLHGHYKHAHSHMCTQMLVLILHTRTSQENEQHLQYH